MKKRLQNLGLFFAGLGFTMHVAVILIAISLGQKNLGETLGNIGLAGLVIILLGLTLMIISLFLSKSSKTKSNLSLS